jgi:3-hydroxymyristoyl/3-hydroxydecanoyl-(acyl carrier protein) dehydratase
VRAVTTVTIAAEHPALAGHFPGAPILPAVLLLDETMRALEQERAPSAGGWRISAAKFLKPVGPGETLSIERDCLPSGAISFRITSGGQPVAHGMLLPGGAPPESAP